MTEKRYYAHKHLLKENEVHDKRCHRFMGLDETVEHLNNEYWKYKQLKDENEGLKDRIDNYNDAFKKLQDLTERKINENEQLKSENQELKSNVIDLIDKKINKLKNINEVSIIPRESVEILKELKKELQE